MTQTVFNAATGVCIPAGTCNTCSKRADEWHQYKPPGYNPYLLAECTHRPRPSFWGRDSDKVWVTAESGSKCPYYVARGGTDGSR